MVASGEWDWQNPITSVKKWLSSITLPTTVFGTYGEQQDSHVLAYNADLAKREQMNQMLIIGAVVIAGILVVRKLKK